MVSVNGTPKMANDAPWMVRLDGSTMGGYCSDLNCAYSICKEFYL